MAVITSKTLPDIAAGKTRKKKKSKGLTRTKAKKILADGKIRGRSLTAKQKRFFGAAAGA